MLRFSIAFDEGIICGPSTSVHAQAYSLPKDIVGEFLRRELASLVRVEDLRCPVLTDGLSQSFPALLGIHGIGHIPIEDIATVQVDDGH